MKSRIVRGTTLLFTGLTALTLLTACQDKRIKDMQAGMSRDSLLSVAAKGTQGSDSMPSIYSHEQYLINGKMLEVLYFDPDNRKAGRDTVPLRKLTPLVMYDGKLIGKGWQVWDSAAQANKIPVPKR